MVCFLKKNQDEEGEATVYTHYREIEEYVPVGLDLMRSEMSLERMLRSFVRLITCSSSE